MTGHNGYRRAIELVEQGKHQDALKLIEEYVVSNPQDVEALNDTGAILHSLGRSEDAVECFLRARKIAPDSPQVLWNLAEAFLALGRPDRVVSLFEDMQKSNLLNPELINRTATMLIDQGNKASAIEALLVSRDTWAGQEVIEPMIEVLRAKRPKVAFFCGGDGMTFLNDVLPFLSRRFQVEVFQGTEPQQMTELMNWADIAWFEWCTNLAVLGSNMSKSCKIIVRLHRYEAYLDWPQQVNWDNVDVLITVGNSFTRKNLVAQVPDIESRTQIETIANGVDLNAFPFVDRPKGKNIAFLSNLRMVKNPGLILQCMQKLNYIDPDYKLFFAGAIQDTVVQQYLEHMVEVLDLSDVVFFDGYQQDVPRWLADKHYIVSTSLVEGVPVGILQAMASGLKPVIHNFPGACEIFPQQYLFNISEEFCDQILSDDYRPKDYRQFVAANYSVTKQLNRVNQLFTEIETQLQTAPQTEPFVHQPNCV